MVEGLDHVAVAVWDTDASLPYYTGQLGLSVVHDERLPEVGVRLTYLNAGGTILQLVQPLGDGPVRRFLEERGEGLHHVCFVVKEIAGTLGALEGEAEAEVFVGGQGRRSCNLLGHPNGLNIELAESLREGARIGEESSVG